MAVNNKKTFLFILITCIAFALSHDAYAARGGIDVDKILAAGGTITITGADGDAPTRQVKRAKKSSKNSGDDFFEDDIEDSDDDEDSGDTEEPKSKAAKNSDIEESEDFDERERNETKQFCKDYGKNNTSVDSGYKNGTCELALIDDKLSLEGIKDKIKDLAKEFNDGCNNANAPAFYSTNTDSVYTVNCEHIKLIISVYKDSIVCNDNYKYNGATGECEESEQESDEEEKEEKEKEKSESANSSTDDNDLFEYDDKIKEKSNSSAAADNDEQPKIDDDDQSDESAKNDENVKKLHADAKKIISAYKETKTKINNKKS